MNNITNTLSYFAKYGLVFVAALAGASSVQAQADWYANPDASGAEWQDYFKNFNAEDYTGTKPYVDIVTDSSYGKVWRISKPSGAKRGEFSRPEVNGSDFSFQEGTTYYIGFRTKFDIRNNLTWEDEEISIFQWKTEGNGEQNYPFNMEWNPGTEKLSLNVFGHGSYQWQSQRRVKAWETSVNEDSWVTIVIGFKYSSDPNQGWVSVWKNGSKQVLGNLETNQYTITKFSSDKKKAYHRTKDSGYNYAKWGIYNENARPYHINNHLSDLRIDTSYSVARPQ